MTLFETCDFVCLWQVRGTDERNFFLSSMGGIEEWMINGVVHETRDNATSLVCFSLSLRHTTFVRYDRREGMIVVPVCTYGTVLLVCTVVCHGTFGNSATPNPTR